MGNWSAIVVMMIATIAIGVNFHQYWYVATKFLADGSFASVIFISIDSCFLCQCFSVTIACKSKWLGTFVLDIEIHRDRSRSLVGFQKAYIGVLTRFNMNGCSPGEASIAKGKNFKSYCPKMVVGERQRYKIPYVSIVGSLMYT